jgi:hypothetical protein
LAGIPFKNRYSAVLAPKFKIRFKSKTNTSGQDHTHTTDAMELSPRRHKAEKRKKNVTLFIAQV